MRFTEEESSEVQDCVSSEPCYSLVENIPLFHLDCENYKGMDEVSGATPNISDSCCSYCSKPFKTKQGMNIHISKVHWQLKEPTSRGAESEARDVPISLDTAVDDCNRKINAVV